MSETNEQNGLVTVDTLETHKAQSHLAGASKQCSKIAEYLRVASNVGVQGLDEPRRLLETAILNIGLTDSFLKSVKTRKERTNIPADPVVRAFQTARDALWKYREVMVCQGEAHHHRGIYSDIEAFEEILGEVQMLQTEEEGDEDD